MQRTDLAIVWLPVRW